MHTSMSVGEGEFLSTYLPTYLPTCLKKNLSDNITEKCHGLLSTFFLSTKCIYTDENMIISKTKLLFEKESKETYTYIKSGDHEVRAIILSIVI